MTDQEYLDYEWDLLYGTAQDPLDEEIEAQSKQIQLEADIRWRSVYNGTRS